LKNIVKKDAPEKWMPPKIAKQSHFSSISTMESRLVRKYEM
jgi:hypothetical protein